MKTMLRAVAALTVLAACSDPSGGSELSLSHVDPTDAGPPRGIGHEARVMTRNLFLGADLAPAIGAPNLPAFVAATGGVLRQLTATDFPTRAKGLADEIRAMNPDLVGLQEVALWRTGPPSLAPLLGAPKTASTVRVDYLALLLDDLNRGPDRYAPVAVEEEFDLEAPADENGVAGDGPNPMIGSAELNARLTMRDVVLERVDAGVTVANAHGGHFQHLLTLPVLGNPVVVTRGWLAVDARVRGTSTFRFVSTHLEAFDPAALHPSIRALQAGELVAPGGPATGDLPVVLVGDLNSDDDTVAPDDQQAYRALLDAGLVERSTADPLSCCIESYDLTTGTSAMFDHQVDHIMTNAPDAVTLVGSAVTGRTMQNGRWDSDHAGLWSALRIR